MGIIYIIVEQKNGPPDWYFHPYQLAVLHWAKTKRNASLKIQTVDLVCTEVMCMIFLRPCFSIIAGWYDPCIFNLSQTFLYTTSFRSMDILIALDPRQGGPGVFVYTPPLCSENLVLYIVLAMCNSWYTVCHHITRLKGKWTHIYAFDQSHLLKKF